MPEVANTLIFFGLYFLSFLFQLIYYSILIWVVLTWVILFGAMKPSNRVFQYFSRLVQPVLRPFSWARLGGVDLSPIAAILVLGYLANVCRNLLLQLL